MLWFTAPDYLARHDHLAVTWVRIGACLLPLSVLSMVALEIRRAEAADLRWNVLRSIPTVITALLVGLLFLAGRLRLGSALAANAAGSVLLILLTLKSTAPVAALRAGAFSRAVLGQVMAFATRASLGSAADLVTSRLDQLVLISLVPSAELGRYALAVTLASASTPLASSFSLAVFGRLLRGSDADAKRLARLTLRYTVASSFAVAVAVAVAARFLLPVVFGRDFEGALLPLIILLPGQVFLDAAGLQSARLTAAGRPAATSAASALGAAVTLALLAVLLPFLGIAGAAITSTFAALARLALLTVSLQKPESVRSSIS